MNHVAGEALTLKALQVQIGRLPARVPILGHLIDDSAIEPAEIFRTAATATAFVERMLKDELLIEMGLQTTGLSQGNCAAFAPTPRLRGSGSARQAGAMGGSLAKVGG